VPPSHADLDIAPRWIEADWALDVGLNFTASDANTNIDDWAHDDGTLKVDLNKLLASAYSAEEYSDTLAWMIFQHLKVASFYRSSLDQAQERPQHLRLRVKGPPSLHYLRWGLLQDPQTGHALATTAQVRFSRYLTNPDYRVVPWRTRQATRALVVIADPKDLDHFRPGNRRPAPVDAELERGIAETALEGFQTEFLVGPGEATLAILTHSLANEVDILYLVCHGALTTDVPVLYLEDEDGNADVVDGRCLQEAIYALPERRTLALLNRCQSAGPGGGSTSTDEGEMTGLGPRLAAAGIATGDLHAGQPVDGALGSSRRCASPRCGVTVSSTARSPPSAEPSVTSSARTGVGPRPSSV